MDQSEIKAGICSQHQARETVRAEKQATGVKRGKTYATLITITLGLVLIGYKYVSNRKINGNLSLSWIISIMLP